MDKKKKQIQDIYAMSPMQEAMFFNSMLDTYSDAYFEQMQLNFEGNINVPQLQTALNLLIKKYAILRSNFINKQAKIPVQVVWDKREVEIAYYDFSAYSNKGEEIEKFKIADREKGFILDKGSLIRLHVIQTEKDKFVLIFSFHHIIMDGWSKTIVLKELFENYQKLCNGQSVMEEKEAPYKDYISWIQKQNKKYAKNFYKEYLDGYIKSEGIFGLGNKIQEQKKYANKNYKFDIPELVCYELYSLSRQYKVTVNSILQTVWGMLVQKYTNTNDVIFGMVMSGRPSEINRIEDMVGVFINTVPVRVQCDVNRDRFIDVVKKVQMNYLMLYDKGYLQLADIVASTQAKESLIDHLFTFENYSGSEDMIKEKFSADDFKLISTNSFEQTSYDFNILFIPMDNLKIQCCLNYNENAVSEIQIQYLKEHLITFLENVIRNPEKISSQLSVVSESEKELILNQMGYYETSEFSNSALKELFEKNIELYSQKIAVEENGKILTYAELNGLSNKIARYLVDKGIEPNQFVGISSDRSIETVIAILGVVKSGAAYVPIDLDYPEDRIKYMIKDCELKVLLTERNVSFDDIIVESISGIMKMESFNKANFFVNNTSLDTLYLIYTSGTTGMPKGVMVNNRSLTNYLDFCKKTYASDQVVMPLFSNLCFDLTVTSIFYPLLNGGKIVVYNDDIDVMIDHIFHNKELTVIKLTPGHLKIANDLLHTETLSGLESLILGGEALETKTISDTLNTFGNHIKIYNEYGPTEATVGCCIYECSGDRDSDECTMPIGKPILNTKVFIMNGNDLLGIGMWGELCVTGEGVTKGYLKKEQLNKERFVSNPFGEGYMYRTGDLAKWNENGILLYAGRFDEQVKIRGYRIELGEVSGAVVSHEAISDAVTIAKTDQDNNQYIYTYFVSQTDIAIGELKEHIKKRVPYYMVPNYMLRVEKIPMTKNGKVNKSQLPEIQIQEKGAFVAPMNELQEVICGLFGEVLGIERIGIEDDFFDLGGHSLKVIRLINRIETELKVKLSIKTVFENATPSKLESIIQQKGKIEIEPILKVEKKEYYPVSFSQQRIYLASTMDYYGTAYNIPVFLKVDGQFEIDRMQSAVDRLVSENEILRTSFHMVDGEIVQKVHENARLLIDYCEMDESAEVLYDFLKSMIKPFSIQDAPLMRINIVKHNEGNYLIAVDMHHIISDGLSNVLMMERLFNYYNEPSCEKDIAPLQYKDYANWMVHKDFTNERKYWNSFLKKDKLTFELPLDHKRPQERDNHSERVTGAVDESTRKKIQEFCKEYNITEYMFMMAVWMILLSKYSDKEDIVMGTVVSGREREDISRMQGVFINTVVLYGRPEKKKSFIKFIKEIKENNMKVMENQTYPFELLIDDLKVERVSNRNPIFDIMFMFQDNEQDIEHKIYQLDNAEVKYISYENKAAKFDITFDVKCTENAYQLGIEYCKVLFNPGTIQKMMEHFIILLHDIIEKPWETVEQLNMISNEEKFFLMHDFNQTEINHDCNDTISGLFDEAVSRMGEKPAVVFHNEVITYAELNRKANVMAEKLRTEGVGKGDYVVIMTERSIEMIIAIYGVIKSGAAYVPVDHNYPTQRIKYIIDDCKPKVILTYHSSIDADIKMIDMGTIDFQVESAEFKSADILPTDIFYLIYTSGTTGNPKGVMIPNSAIVNYCNANPLNIMGGAIDTKYTKIVSVTNMVFDIFHTETVMSLLNGMTVYLADAEQQESGKKLKELIDKNGIEVIQTTPSRINMLLEESNFMSGLKVILVGGEKLRSSLAKKIRENTDARLVNVYGPSETTIWSSMQIVEQDEENIPIGKPIANTTIYVMKEEKLAGIDIAGELCIGGEGLSSGYLNKRELTSQKFVYSDELGETIYHTGDLAKISSEGKLLYLGRKDEQVKIRGHRIELGEIESVIRKYEPVKEAVVITRKDEHDEDELYAYVISDTAVDFDQLEDEIRKYLPGYMIPGYYMQIDKIPVNKNGKLDKKSLPNNFEKRQSTYIMPQTEYEILVCSLFGKILDVDKVGVQDDFFKMGGNSVNAVKLMNEIEKKTKIRMVLRLIFERSTPKMIADYLENHLRTNEEVIPVAEDKEYYLASPAQRSIFMSTEVVNADIAYNLPFYLQVDEKIDYRKLQAAFNQLIHRHEALRTAFLNVEGDIVQKIEKKVSVTIDVLEYEKCDEGVLSRLVEPFALDKAPLIRLKLIRMKDQEIIFVDMHHIIADGMSIELIKNELLRLYRGEIMNPPKVQYKDFSEWLSYKDISEQKNYWIDQLKDITGPLELPYDHVPQNMDKNVCGEVNACLDENIVKRIKKIAGSERCTEYHVMLSGLFILLSKYCNQEEIVIGGPVSGRTNKELADVVGMFVNTVVLKATVDKKQNYKDFLHEIKEMCISAFENQEYYFEDLVHECKNITLNGNNVLINTLFSMQSNKTKRINKCTELNIQKKKSSKFDLVFQVALIEGKYQIRIEYNAKLFEETTLVYMIKHYTDIVREIAYNLDNTIQCINMISKEEEHRILNEWNNTAIEYPHFKSMAELFSEQVSRNRDRIAICYKERSLNYGELDELSDCLAMHLRNHSIAQGDAVTVFAEKKIEIIAAIVAIIKLGAIYVPVDPRYPTERIKFIIENTRSKLLLMYQNSINVDTEKLDLSVLDMERMYQKVTLPVSDSSLPAYIMHTSGTTGNPKGVVVTQKNIIRLVKNTNFCRFDQDTIMLQTGSLAFDAATMEIWGPLLNGGLLCLEENEVILDAERLKETIQKQKVNALFMTTTLFNQMILADRLLFSSVEYVMVGGEKITEKFIRMMAEEKENHKIKLINGYGPTENTTFSTTYQIDWNHINDIIPIGSPIANSTAYVMDGNHLCGVGVVGELCLGGDGLSIGYMNEEELTNEKYFKNPFGEGKLYRSGDLAKWNDDGTITYLGRIDNQVKIRGFRIELKEIENVFREIPHIQDVCVIAREDSYNVKNLYGYFAADREMDIWEIYKELKKHLPDYMIPLKMLQIEKLPMNVNKKIDIKALPEIVDNILVDVVLPETEIQKEILEIWKEELDFENISIYDSFFNIGGNSLKAVRIFNKLKRIDKGLLLGDILKYDTIHGLAEIIEIHNAEIQNKTTDEMNDKSKKKFEKKDGNIEVILEEIFSHYLEENSILEQQILSSEIAETYHSTAMQKYYLNENKTSGEYFIFERNESDEAIINAVANVMRRYEAFGTIVDENQMMKQYHLPENLRIPYYDISQYNQEMVESIVQSLLKKVFSMKGSIINHLLYKVFIVRLDGARFLIAFPFNHCMFDGTSIDVLKRAFFESVRNDKFMSIKRCHKDYSERLIMGPVGISEDELIEKFDLCRFVQDTLELNDKIHVNDVNYKQRKIRMEFEVTSEYESQMQELAYSLCIFLVGKLYNMDRIPMKLVGIGRRYENSTYFDSIGLFIDYIPVLLDYTEKYCKDIMDIVSEKVNDSAIHNINFSTLAYEKLVDFPKVSKMIQDSISKGGVVFNFQNQIVEQGYYETDSEDVIGKTNLQNVNFVAYAINNRLSLNVDLIHFKDKKEICCMIESYMKHFKL